MRNILLRIDKNVKPTEFNYANMFFERLSLPGAREAFISALEGSAHAPRISDRLNKIKAKTLLIWGKQLTIIDIIVNGIVILIVVVSIVHIIRR